MRDLPSRESVTDDISDLQTADPIAGILPGTPLNVASAVLSCLSEHLDDYLDCDLTRIQVRNGPTCPMEIFYREERCL